MDGTQNERIEKGGTDRWLENFKEAEVLFVGHFKRRHSLGKVIMEGWERKNWERPRRKGERGTCNVFDKPLGRLNF